MEQQNEITQDMRAVLVDWLVEVQESFELNHETLYSAVRLVDLYLSRATVNKENLQLVGTTAMLISSKFEVSALFTVCSFFLTNVGLPLGTVSSLRRRFLVHLRRCLHETGPHQDGNEHSESSRLRHRPAIVLQLPSPIRSGKNPLCYYSLFSLIWLLF